MDESLLSRPLCLHVCPFIKQIALIHSSAHQSPEHLSFGAVGSSIAEMTEWKEVETPTLYPHQSRQHHSRLLGVRMCKVLQGCLTECLSFQGWAEGAGAGVEFKGMLGERWSRVLLTQQKPYADVILLFFTICPIEMLRKKKLSF